MVTKRFAQSGVGSGQGLYGPSQGEGLGLGFPGGGGQGVPHSTRLPPSHQGHGGNLVEGPQSGNNIADHALETLPFSKTLGDFTVEELMGQIKALMKVKTPESMQKAQFLQDVLRDKMQRLKAARRTFDTHVMIKNASMVRNLKEDPFTQALFAEHNVPLDALDDAVIPVEITHFSLHNLVHKLAQVLTADALEELTTRVQEELQKDLSREELEALRIQVAKEVAPAQGSPIEDEARHLLNMIDQRIKEVAQESRETSSDLIEQLYRDLQNLPFDQWPAVVQRYKEAQANDEYVAETIQEAVYETLIAQVDIKSGPWADREGVPHLSQKSLEQFYAVASILVPYLDRAKRFTGVITRIVDLVSEVAKTIMAGARGGILWHLIVGMSDRVDEAFPTIAQKMKDGDITGQELVSATQHWLGDDDPWTQIAKAYANIERHIPINVGNLAQAIHDVHIALHIFHHGGLVLGDYVPVVNSDGERVAKEDIIALLDEKTQRWDEETVKERAPQIYQLVENLKRRHAQLKALMKLAKGGPRIETLKKNKKPLTDEERKKVMDAGAVWHHGPKGEETPAIWKAEVNGKTWYICNTHRAYQCKDTLDKAIKSYDFIKTTAQTAQPIKGKCPESGEVRYMSQSDLVQHDYKADCPEGKRKLRDQKSVSIEEYKKHKKHKKKKAQVEEPSDQDVVNALEQRGLSEGDFASTEGFVKEQNIVKKWGTSTGSLTGCAEAALREEANLTKRTQKDKLKFNEKEQKIINAVKEAAEDLDINCYLVGGAVRDRLLGRKNVDLDFMCEKDAERLVEYLAKKYNTEMPVRYERSKAIMITLDGEPLDFINAERLFQPLKKEEALEGEEEFTVSFDDAYHRDLTINTLMYDLRRDKLLDPTGRGLRDLRNKQINTVIDPFIKFKIHAPDMLRALRFAATLGFELGPNMIEAMRENAERLRPRDKGGDISNRRIRKELRKAIDDPQHWATMRRLLSEAGLDAILADDIDDVQQDFIGGIEYHLEEKAMRIKRLTKSAGLFDFWKKKEQGMPTKEERLRYIAEQIDKTLAKAPRSKHNQIVDRMLTEWKISQNMPEYAHILTLLKNYRPKAAAPGHSREDVWMD